MNRDKLKSVKKIVVHDACPDGIASALILKDALPDAEVVWQQYSTPAHRAFEPEPGVLFADFSPFVDRDKSGKMTNLYQAQAWVGAGAIVLDHHKGTQDLVEMFGDNGAFGDEKLNPGMSGAVLAFDHVWTPLRGGHVMRPEYESVKAFAETAGVRDTWQKNDPRWRESCAQAAALMFWPREILLKEGLLNIASRLQIGETLLRRDEEADKRTLAGAHRFEVSAERLRVVCFEMGENSRPVSDISERLGAEADLVIGWHYEVQDGSPVLRLSSRSRGVFDCAKLAKAHGGNGHTNAAGFRLSGHAITTNPYTTVELLVRDYLTR